MKTRWWVVALFLAFLTGGWGGHYVAQDAPEPIECLVKVDAPPCECVCVVQSCSTPPIESTGECPPCPEVQLRVEPASYRYLLHGVIGGSQYGVGTTWNRVGRWKPTAMVLWDDRNFNLRHTWNHSYNSYDHHLSVDRSGVVGMVGVTIGLVPR